MSRTLNACLLFLNVVVISMEDSKEVCHRNTFVLVAPSQGPSARTPGSVLVSSRCRAPSIPRGIDFALRLRGGSAAGDVEVVEQRVQLLLTPHVKARTSRLDGLVKVQGEDQIVKRRGRMRKEDSTEQVKKRLNKLNTLLQSYQIDGVQWLISLYENGLNGILADEMGLGKTIQVIAFLAHLWEMKVHGPFLVVAPLSTIGNWQNEFKRFAPDLPVLLYHGSKDERKELRKQHLKHRAKEFPIVITSFEIVMNDAKSLSQYRWKYLTVDEGHRIKNKDCKLLRELKALNAGNRLLLTGTPLQNNLSELWSLLNFILPEIFDDLSTFQAWFNFEEELTDSQGAAKIMLQEEQNKIISKLHAILDPFLLRRLKSDVALELPDKHVYVLFASFSPSQARYNQAIANNSLWELLENVTDSAMLQDEATTAMTNPQSSLENMMMQMRKCCNHPYLFASPIDEHGEFVVDERVLEASGKMQLLDRMLRILKENGNKVLIFFQMTRMMDIVEDYVRDVRNWDCCRIDGKEQIHRFNHNSSSFIFLLSTRAGGLGISLPAADTVIIYDSDFNPQQDLQAQDRCHRIGQQKPVGVYRLITRDSVEVKIFERAVRKRKLELMTINRKLFKDHQKLQGSTDLSSLLKGELEITQSFTKDELQELLLVNVQPTREGTVSDENLRMLLLDRGDKAPKTSGPGWELVDAETSSFVVKE
ncbi:hypothetical protein GUITHDRAFT_103852 [Guillardia theta CCMP2712]|uniref:Uncharacterized protein n=1 Tax=Guillardia theta (strain CCMP2712) TaxID=905079 RepID=L1JR10_GUITC|nr:hypothetical protein GUITHDRAFT_103852 [Guillardia theta CCMP2712]EKX50630.1 hypothetical protein GUITHDRAFT_103852 [Guillardia theta CCMP2712]|eukprot:XP_005837610.1 hypothetical protein GUITHDRAFT_103852 [Guillardia theta CCMP2712]